MSYDANSPQARKGKIGEQIVKRFVEALGWRCEKPDGVTEDTPTHIDWLCRTPNGAKVAVEVKTYKKFPYSFNQIPTFKIPLTWYENYKTEAVRLGAEKFELWFVSSEDGLIYAADSQILERKIRRGGYEFPVTVDFEGDRHICFHVDQFYRQLIISDEELADLIYVDEEIAADDALDRQSLEHFGKAFPDAVRDGLHQLNREFSGNQILNAIRALQTRSDENFPILLDKLLNGSKALALVKMFLRQVRAELEKPSTSTEKPTVEPAEMSLNVLIEQLATAVNLSANDLAEAILEMRSIRFDEQQDRLKARLLGGTKHER